MTVILLIDKLEKLYPNDVFQLDKKSEKERNEYIVKLNMIEEIKTMEGLKNETK